MNIDWLSFACGAGAMLALSCVATLLLVRLLPRASEPVTKSPGLQNASVLASWFREVATLSDAERQHLRVALSPDDCLEVARLLESGISLYQCSPDEADLTGVER